MENPIIAKHIFKVTEKTYITPHYIRIKLKSEDDIAFDQCTPGANNKIFIPPAGQTEVQFASFDSEKGEWVMPDESVKPLVRTYTHRGIDPQSKEISIDFVNHGDNGPASAWARNAELQDQLGVAMKIRPTKLYTEADWYFLIADATAIPVLCCILESLPPEAKGYMVVEVPSEADIHPEVTHPGFEVHWVINSMPEMGSQLASITKQIPIPSNKSRFAHIACEYSTVKELRSYFKNELQWTKEEFYAFSYWKAGIAEDHSAKERREEKNA